MRLIGLAYPAQTGSLLESISIDAFADALDPELRLKILEKTPVTLQEALAIATHQEALGCGSTTDHSDAFDDGGKRKQPKFVSAVETSKDVRY